MAKPIVIINKPTETLVDIQIAGVVYSKQDKYDLKDFTRLLNQLLSEWGV